jgi:hypothetical protein
MRFRRSKEDAPTPPPGGGFAAWLLRQFNGGKPTAEMPYAEIERVCANAGSLLFGAAFANPEAFTDPNAPTEQHTEAAEAALLSRRTADGFQAALDDRNNAVIAWPWDHLATKVAWEATRANDTSEEHLAAAIASVGTTYAIRHREQLTAVLDLWGQVAANIGATSQEPDLAKLGSQMLAAYQATTAA